MQIANWPLRDRRFESIGVLVLVAVLAFVAARVGHSVYLGIFVGIGLMVSVWRLLAPIRYELDARGLQQICAGRRRFSPWSDFACYRFDSKGVMLLREEGPLALNALRGVFIYAGDRQEELESLVAFYLPDASGNHAQTSGANSVASGMANNVASNVASDAPRQLGKGAAHGD